MFKWKASLVSHPRVLFRLGFSTTGDTFLVCIYPSPLGGQLPSQSPCLRGLSWAVLFDSSEVLDRWPVFWVMSEDGLSLTPVLSFLEQSPFPTDREWAAGWGRFTWGNPHACLWGGTEELCPLQSWPGPGTWGSVSTLKELTASLRWQTTRPDELETRIHTFSLCAWASSCSSSFLLSLGCCNDLLAGPQI